MYIMRVHDYLYKFNALRRGVGALEISIINIIITIGIILHVCGKKRSSAVLTAASLPVS